MNFCYSPLNDEMDMEDYTCDFLRKGGERIEAYNARLTIEEVEQMNPHGKAECGKIGLQICADYWHC